MENKNKPAFACATGDAQNGHLQEGLTKHEYFALELTKAVVTGVFSTSTANTYHGWSDEELISTGISLADEILKRLEDGE